MKGAPMETEVVLDCRERPALWPLYRRVLFTRRSGVRKGGRVPDLSSAWRGVTVDEQQLPAYREICEISSEGSLPLLYPYVLTSILQLAIVAAPKFPVNLFGMVHQRNRITQYRPIGEKERMDASARVGESRIVKQGLEFDIGTQVTVDGKAVWECVSTYLARGSYGEPGDAPANSRLPDLEAPTADATWKVPPGMGRRYARVCGDYNLIHISSILARFFGFKKAIVHGMWSAARCLVHVPKIDESGPVRFDVAFKGPIFMGSRVTMKRAEQCGGQRFDLFCGDNPRPCLCGLLRTGASAEPLA
jgi:hypothetical protein